MTGGGCLLQYRKSRGIHFTEHPKKPLAAGSVGVRVGSSYIKRPRQCPVRDTAWVSRGSMDMKIGISL